MKHQARVRLSLAVLLLAPAAVYASCDSAKDAVDAKIKAKVSSYSLTVIDAADKDKADGKVVGSCESGKKLLVYKRGAAAGPAAAEPAKP